MSDFSMEQMQEMQRRMLDRYKHTWEPLSPESGRNHVLWMISEIGEVIDIIKKRGDARIMDDPAVRTHFIEEMVDVMMFYNDVMLCYGITPQELKDTYVRKFERNLERW